MKSLYDVLGITSESSPKQIKDAFRKRAKDLHPDHDGGDEEKMKELNKAYSILKNPSLRKKYDETGDADECDVNNTEPAIVRFMAELTFEMVKSPPASVASFLKSKLVIWERCYQQAKGATKHELVNLEKFKERIESVPENNTVIVDIIDDNIKAIKSRLKDIDTDFGYRSEAIKRMQEYKFKDDEEDESFDALFNSNFGWHVATIKAKKNG
jgi:curved DNA-binding protein CbpA